MSTATPAPDKNDEASKALEAIFATITTGDKIFLRAKLDIPFTQIVEEQDLLMAVGLWKRNGGGNSNWGFVLEMTDAAIMTELGFDTDTIVKADAE